MPIVDVPGVGRIQFPEGMTEEQMSQAIQSNFQPPKETPTLQGLTGENIWKATRKGIDISNQAAGRALQDTKEELAQLALAGGNTVGLVSDDTYNQYTQQADAGRRAYENSEAGKDTIAKGLRTTLNLEKYLALPFARGAGILKNTAVNTGIGAGVGAAQYVPENGSRLENTLIGGGLGALGTPIGLGLGSKNPYIKGGTGAGVGALMGLGLGGTTGAAVGGLLGLGLPFAPALGIEAVKNLANKASEKVRGKPLFTQNPNANPVNAAVAQDMLTGVDAKAALKVKQAGERLGLNLRPAEASGSPLAAAAEGNLGTTKKGAQSMYAFSQAQKQKQQKSITNLLDEIEGTGQPAAANVRGAAKGLFKQESELLQKAAKPYYDKAYEKSIPEDTLNMLLQDPVINRSFGRISKIPEYQKDLVGAAPNSLQYLNVVKKHIDDLNGAAVRKGKANISRILTDSKNRLKDELVAVSDDYKNALYIYGEGSGRLQKLKESPLGRLANLKDKDLKSVSRIIFDPAETNPKVLAQLRDKITQVNPDAWRGILRNHLENGLDRVGGPSAGGSAFYNKFLKNDRSFNQLLTASKNIKGTTQKLIDMRRAFKDLINFEGVKTAAFQARKNIDNPRNDLSSYAQLAKNALGSKYDEAAIEFVQSGKWDKEFKTIMQNKEPNARAAKFVSLLSRIAAEQATNPRGQFEEDE